MMKRTKRIWLAIPTAAVLIAVTAMLFGRIPGYGPKDWLASYLRGHLTSVPDELVAAEMRQIAALDQVGLLILVDALGSPRPSVAEAAAATLHEQLDGWQKLPRERSSKPVASVAQELARRVGGWPNTARCAAADLALRIVDWPIDNRQVQRAKLIADCECVMRAQQGSHTSTALARAPTDISRVEDASLPVAARDVRPSANAPWDASPIPGGDVPVAEVEFPPLPPSLAASPESRLAENREPSLLPPAGLSSSDVKRPGRASLTDESPPAPAPPADLRSWNRPLDEPSSAETPANAPVDSLPRNLETLSDLELIRNLDGRDPESSRQVLAVLGQRGFRKIDLALAHQLASPDVATRRQLVETVGRLPAGAGRWLIWLSQDPDPMVRKASVSLMVTAQDPSVQRRLLAMENGEVDQDVREQLQRWRDLRK